MQLKMPSIEESIQNYIITVRLLDGSSIKCEFSRDVISQSVIDYICTNLGVSDKSYFGLRFKDMHKQRRWVSLDSPLYKELKKCESPYLMYFRLFFYPTTNINKIGLNTLNMIITQLQKDFAHGRVICSPEQARFYVSYLLIIKGFVDDESLELNLNCKNFPILKDLDVSEIKNETSKLRGICPNKAAVILIEKMIEDRVFGLDPHPLDEQNFSKIVGLYPDCLSQINDFERNDILSWKSFHKVTRFNCKITIFWKTDGQKKMISFIFKKKRYAKHLQECVLHFARFYANYNPRKAPIRRAFTSIGGKHSRPDSYAHPVSEISPAVNDHPIHSKVSLSFTQGPSKGYGLVRSLSKIEENQRPASYSENNNAPSSFDSDSNSNIFKTNQDFKFSNNPLPPVKNCDEALNDVTCPHVKGTRKEGSYMVINSFQLGLFILLIAVLLFFSLIAFK